MNIAVFINYYHQIPIFLGLFGKENLIYESVFDAKEFDNSSTQIYYHKKLNTKFYFYNGDHSFLNEKNEFFEQYKNCIFFAENLNPDEKIIEKINSIKNSKKIFIWHYGEVFDRNILATVQKRNYDLIYTGSSRPELNDSNSYVFDPLMPLRYFRYYIGYYWLESLMQKIDIPKYNKNIPKLFSYVRAYGSSSWRKKFINKIKNLEPLLSKKDSANDAYDLLFPKYKHFESISDYIFCNFNLIFETIDPHNNQEWFLTEKTYKGLFFGKPFFLIAPTDALNYLKKIGFFILNFEFIDNINNVTDVEKSIQNFVNWLENASDEEIEIKFNEYLKKSLNNRKLLFSYIEDYESTEKIIQNLLTNK